jgi:hypothetical protein
MIIIMLSWLLGWQKELNSKVLYFEIAIILHIMENVIVKLYE